MCKVVLVNPGIEQASEAPPINLAILASYLEQNGHTVKIIDMLSGGNIHEIESLKPDVVGITGTTPVIPYTYKIADYTRRLGIYTVIGGVHSSILPNDALQHADAVVVGEGEKTLLDLVNTRKTGIFNGITVENLDELGIPSYKLLNMEYYLNILQRQEMCFCAFAPRHFRVACIVTSRGCPYDCTFCHNSYRSTKCRYRSPKKVIEEIKYLIDNYNIDALFFCDDNLFSNIPRLKEICSLMKSEGISRNIIWGANGRVNNINEELLQMVKDANCKQVTFGWESGSQRTLNKLNKHTTVEQNRKSIELCNKVGINASGTFMIGNPDEKIEDIIQTKEFIENNHITSGIGICISTPYPGTKMWEWCKDKGIIPCNLQWKTLDYHSVPIKMHKVDDTDFNNIYNELVRIAINKFITSRNERLSK
jgi:anaerobic magnesium-protoporphyrin IX monomethyl ester cyclase